MAIGQQQLTKAELMGDPHVERIVTEAVLGIACLIRTVDAVAVPVAGGKGTARVSLS
jgi:hypothetical protein